MGPAPTAKSKIGFFARLGLLLGPAGIVLVFFPRPHARQALPLLAADSKAGILCFSFGDGQGEMRLVPAGRDGSAAVRLRLSGTGPDLTGVLFDELGSALRRSRETESRRKDP